jgi:hypothetical protein
LGQNKSQNELGFKSNNNSNLLIEQNNQIRRENKERLKECKNLEDLVNFKVKTIADSLPFKQDSKGQSVQALKKICDPLLSNWEYPKLLKQKHTEYEVPKIFE